MPRDLASKLSRLVLRQHFELTVFVDGIRSCDTSTVSGKGFI
jgi:hypothetical protein